MKTAGIIGGIGPPSTIEYYRLIIASYREQKRDGSYPHLLINSIDLNRMRSLIETNNLPEVTEYLLGQIRKLGDAGADFGALAVNTPHLVFDALRRRSPIPLISIVEVTCQAAKVGGMTRIGLLGTRFTMQSSFYPDVFTPAGITLAAPTAEEQDYIHDRYMNELVNDIILPETRAGMLTIIKRLKAEERIDGVILGGTELPLLLGGVADAAIPFLDTTRLHCGDTVNMRGHAFAREVEKMVNSFGYQTVAEIEMTKLGAPKKDGLGDIDVLAWDVPTGLVIAIECKRLMTAVTVREVIQRLEDFRGNRDEKDSLGRHLRRMDWLTKHLENLSKLTSIPVARIRLVPLLVTSETVPMQFFAEMKLSVSNVVPYDELEQYITGNLPIGGQGEQVS